ncbi:MAG: alkaline phosphatase family protein [Patescibacteria group bacterium]|jgi:predicted AlkP superfamily pyrophosphatase or phosphodiesterase
MANLVIFIDGFPYDQLAQTDFLNNLKKSRRIPGIGYSFNLYLEMFAGLVPDQSGVFCEFAFEPQRLQNKTVRILMPVLKIIDKLGIFSSLFKRFVTGYCGFKFHNVPFAYRYFFTDAGKQIQRPDLREKTIFKKIEKLSNGKIFDHSICCYTDKESVGLFYQNIDADNLFIHFTELDGAGHAGFLSAEYFAKLKWLDDKLKNIWQKYQERHPGANLIILSDHGFCSVEKFIRPEFERIGSLKAGRDYFYFVDTTMVKFWFLSQAAKEAVLKYLSGLDFGRVLSEQERLASGIADKKFADEIFLLQPGIAFFPSFYGGIIKVKGVHGYGPECSGHHGIFLYNTPRRVEIAPIINNKETYQCILDILDLK